MKVALHGLVGGLTASLGGGNVLSGATSAMANESLMAQMNKLSPDQQRIAGLIIGGAVGKLTGSAQTGATTAENGTLYNRQAASAYDLVDGDILKQDNKYYKVETVDGKVKHDYIGDSVPYGTVFWSAADHQFYEQDWLGDAWNSENNRPNLFDGPGSKMTPGAGENINQTKMNTDFLSDSAVSPPAPARSIGDQWLDSGKASLGYERSTGLAIAIKADGTVEYAPGRPSRGDMLYQNGDGVAPTYDANGRAWAKNDDGSYYPIYSLMNSSTKGSITNANPITKSLDSITGIAGDINKELITRGNTALNSPYDFANYLTIGLLDGVNSGSKNRANNMFNSKYDFANWMTNGTLGMVNGAINPTDPLSKEHWENSFGLAAIFAGGVKPSIATEVDAGATSEIATTNTSGAGLWGTTKNILRDETGSVKIPGEQEGVPGSSNADGGTATTIAGSNINHINGAIGEAQGYQYATQDLKQIGIQAPGNVTTPGPDFITFDPANGTINVWDAKFRSNLNFPSSANGFGSQAWLQEVQQAINNIPDATLRQQVQQAYTNGKINWNIFQWPPK
jgi:hypothetical protein